MDNKLPVLLNFNITDYSVCSLAIVSIFIYCVPIDYCVVAVCLFVCLLDIYVIVLTLWPVFVISLGLSRPFLFTPACLSVICLLFGRLFVCLLCINSCKVLLSQCSRLSYSCAVYADL